MTTSNPLVGGWQLQSWDIRYGDGRPQTRPFGDRPEGLIVYTPDYWMNASIARAGRPAPSAESARKAPEQERLDAFESFFNYGGRYRIEGDTVVHSVTVALNQAFVGTEQRRRMQFEGDTLTLSGEDTLPGTEITRHHRLVWRKAAS